MLLYDLDDDQMKMVEIVHLCDLSQFDDEQVFKIDEVDEVENIMNEFDIEQRDNEIIDEFEQEEVTTIGLDDEVVERDEFDEMPTQAMYEDDEMVVFELQAI